MRYEHWLLPPKSSPWPGAMLCLSTSVSWHSLPGETCREHIQLEQWHATLCVRSGDKYTIARSAVGNDAESFWRTLKTATLRCNNLWVLCAGTRESAAALGLWERLESGHVRLEGRDPQSDTSGPHAMSDVRRVRSRNVDAKEGSVDRDRLPKLSRRLAKAPRSTASRHGAARNRPSGLCVLQDPPIILELRIGGGGCKIIWVDAANYGIVVSSVASGRSCPDLDLAQWFVGAASTLQSLGRCGWMHTAGSQAMHLFRSAYHRTPILSHTEGHATALERDGLFGGRCEVYQYGRIAGPVHLYDIRSMYPYLCAHNQVPVALQYVLGGITPTELLERMGSDTFAIARVDIETEEPDYPYRLTQWDEIYVNKQTVLARKAMPHESRVIYPIGRYTTVLAGEELVRAARSGHLQRVRYTALYKCAQALEAFQRALYAVRCRSDNQGTTELSAYIKALMVSLPGKFAQQDRKWVDMPNAELPTEWGEYYWISPANECVRYRSIAGHVQVEEVGGFSYGSVPAISVAIASSGRNRLLAIIQAAGWENTYYVDTDAIIVSDIGRERIINAGWVRPGQWGYLQHVVSADWCEIYGVKRYRIGGRIRFAGKLSEAVCDIQDDRRNQNIPPIGAAIRTRQRPADWRAGVKSESMGQTLDNAHSQGERVQPIRINRWDVT